MRNKYTAFLCLVIAVSAPLGVATCQRANRIETRVETVANPDAGCLSSSEISNVVVKIANSTSETESSQGQSVIQSEIGRSPACRAGVINVLIGILNKPNATVVSDPELFNLWRTVANLLGEIRAVEAVDVLVSHLDLHSPVFSTTMSQQPALQAVIRIGPGALGRLEAVLKNDSNRDMRRYAVYCIARIGGQGAISLLEPISQSEQDPCVRRFISISLESLKNNKGHLGPNTSKWFGAFMCTE